VKRCDRLIDVGRRRFLSGAGMAAAGAAAAGVLPANATPAPARVDYPSAMFPVGAGKPHPSPLRRTQWMPALPSRRLVSGQLDDAKPDQPLHLIRIEDHIRTRACWMCDSNGPMTLRHFGIRHVCP
jgi:hypothetical protein